MKRGIVKRFVIACVVLLFTSTCGHSRGGAAMSHSDAEGLWQQAREIPTSGGVGKRLDDTYTFKYEHDLVTLRLLVVSKARWKSDDSFYALKARWEGNTLYFLPPLGQWTALAAFEDGKFVMYGDGKKREYERVAPEQVAEFSKDILRPDRSVFDYDLAK
jgi:hypothetical protein